MTMQLHIFEGGQIWLDTEASTMQALMAETRWEWRKVEYMRRHLKPGMTFVDAGAFNGYFSLIAAKLVGEMGQVFAFEPNPDNIHQFEMNRHANSFKNVEIFPLALNDKDATMTLYWAAGRSSAFPPVEHRGYSDVKCNRLDTVFKRRRADMMKIDVEGMELGVLQGARHTIQGSVHLHILFDLHPELGVTPDGIEDFLLAHGFKLYDIRSDFAPIEHIPDTLVELLAVK